MRQNSRVGIKPLSFKIKPILDQDMEKCDICGNKIAELFLGKIKGTIVKKAKSNKQYYICFECQKKFKNKEELLKQIN